MLPDFEVIQSSLFADLRGKSSTLLAGRRVMIMTSDRFLPRSSSKETGHSFLFPVETSWCNREGLILRRWRRWRSHQVGQVKSRSWATRRRRRLRPTSLTAAAPVGTSDRRKGTSCAPWWGRRGRNRSRARTPAP